MSEHAHCNFNIDNKPHPPSVTHNNVETMASATFLPGIVVSMIIVTGYVYPRLFCLGIKSASGRPIPPDPRGIFIIKGVFINRAARSCDM